MRDWVVIKLHIEEATGYKIFTLGRIKLSNTYFCNYNIKSPT